MLRKSTTILSALAAVVTFSIAMPSVCQASNRNVVFVNGTQTGSALIKDPLTHTINIADRAYLNMQIVTDNVTGYWAGSYAYSDSKGISSSGGMKAINSLTTGGFKITFAALVKSFNDRFVVTVNLAVPTSNGQQDQLKIDLLNAKGVSYPGFPRSGYFDVANSVVLTP